MAQVWRDLKPFVICTVVLAVGGVFAVAIVNGLLPRLGIDPAGVWPVMFGAGVFMYVIGCVKRRLKAQATTK